MGCRGAREKRLLRKEGGGGGGGSCCLKADHVWEAEIWSSTQQPGDLQITSRVRLVVSYYIKFATVADLTISVR